MMFNAQYLQDFLASFTKTSNFLIAYSGGLDSHVLLHALAQLPQKLPLRAIHINHGWHKDAELWTQHCINTCENLNISCEVIKIDAQAIRGQSLEAIARDARYQAFAEIMHKDDCLLTAHHQDDQAETLLLQLLRGAGVKGLASMPAVTTFANGYLLRPLLNFSRIELEVYAKENKLNWIDDDSNLNVKFDRNFIRHELMPDIRRRWPQAQITLARAAKNCAEAAELLNILAAEDLEKIGRPPLAPTLPIAKLLQLNIARQKNVLRYWLQQLNFSLPSEVQLERVLKDVLNSSVDADPKVCWDEVEVRRYRDELFVFHVGAGLVPAHAGHPQGTPLHLTEIIWDLTQPLTIPNIGVLTANKIKNQGIRCGALPDNKLTVRFRHNGERFHPAGRQGSHPLKKLFQEWGVPPWQRDQVPLLFLDDELIAVVGYAVSEKFKANENEMGWVVTHRFSLKQI